MAGTAAMATITPVREPAGAPVGGLLRAMAAAHLHLAALVRQIMHLQPAAAAAVLTMAAAEAGRMDRVAVAVAVAQAASVRQHLRAR
jgi:hypothetical protein